MNKKLINQILKFTVVGGLAFIVDYGLMVILTEIFKVNYLMSTTISFCVSVIFNYYLSTLWVFNVDNEKSKPLVFSIFIILSIIGLLLNDLLMWLFVEKVFINYLIAKIIATFIVMVYNFITRKMFLERNDENG